MNAPVQPLTYTKQQLCEALGVKERTFDDHRAALERTGFPPRLPAFGARWSRAAVEYWITTNGGRLPLPPGTDPVGEARGLLEARYGAAGNVRPLAAAALDHEVAQFERLGDELAGRVIELEKGRRDAAGSARAAPHKGESA